MQGFFGFFFFFQYATDTPTLDFLSVSKLYELLDKVTSSHSGMAPAPPDPPTQKLSLVRHWIS